MTRNGGVLRLVAIGFASWLGVTALQTASAGPLFPNALAIPGSSNSVELRHDPAGVNQYYGDIEYAVFTAANFGLAFPGQDTPNGGVAAGEFVYAFQVFNAGTRGDIAQFTAGLADIGPPLNPLHHGDGVDDAESVNAGDQDFIAGSGQDPSSSQVTASVLYGASSGSSVRFNFAGSSAARLNSGELSSILFYTSPWAPRFENGSTATGAGMSRIPGPEEGRIQPFIPEPSSLALAVGALCALLMGRRGK
jgi:hypothetical protein